VPVVLLLAVGVSAGADAWEALNMAMLQDTLDGTDTLQVSLIVPGDSVTVLARAVFLFNSSDGDILVGTDSTLLPLRVYRYGDTASMFYCPEGFSPADGWRYIYIAGVAANTGLITVAFWYN
jgi:hypothetical protein